MKKAGFNDCLESLLLEDAWVLREDLAVAEKQASERKDDEPKAAEIPAKRGSCQTEVLSQLRNSASVVCSVSILPRVHSTRM